jgi:hypothetical protein
MKQTALPTANYTMLPNILLEDLIPLMGLAEIKVVLAMCRKIFGYHKTAPEPISVTLLQKLTGLSRQGVLNGLSAAIDRGIVIVAAYGPRGSHLYTLKLVDYAQLVNEVDQSTELTSTGKATRPDLVNEVDPQKKGKETSKESSTPDSVEQLSRSDEAAHSVLAPTAQESAEALTPEAAAQERPAPARKRDPMFDLIADRGFKLGTSDTIPGARVKMVQKHFGGKDVRRTKSGPVIPGASPPVLLDEARRFFDWIDDKGIEIRDIQKYAERVIEFRNQSRLNTRHNLTDTTPPPRREDLHADADDFLRLDKQGRVIGEARS